MNRLKIVLNSWEGGKTLTVLPNGNNIWEVKDSSLLMDFACGDRNIGVDVANLKALSSWLATIDS